MVPCFIERTPGLSAELSILLVTEPSEALRKVGCHGRGGPPKLARQSKFLEIWKGPGHAIDLPPKLSSGPPHLQILKVSDWGARCCQGLSQRVIPARLDFPVSNFQFPVSVFIRPA